MGKGNRHAMRDVIPDVRDGLTQVERIIMTVLHRTQKEMGDRSVSTVMVYGRVCELIDISPQEFQRHLQRLTGKLNPPH